MATIKLSEWCEKTGINYLKAYRWFKSNKLPVSAYQTDTGTILVEDEDYETTEQKIENNDAMSLFLKKTVEYSKNNSTVEDFAAYIISNFTLKNINSPATINLPVYSKNKPKSENVQKYFAPFFPPKEKTDQIKMTVALIKDNENARSANNFIDSPTSDVEVEITPQQQINTHTSSTDIGAIDNILPSNKETEPTLYSFEPTTKEIETAQKIIKTSKKSKGN